jgi:type II secretory pathway component GspD/PulD (secretin)
VNLLSALQLVARGRVRVAAEADPAPSEPTSNFLTLSLPDNGIAYLLNVLNRQQTSAEVLAKPSLVALDRTPSVFFSGATLTVPVTSAFTGTLQEKSVGVSLAVTPTFVSDDEVLLAVSAGRSFLDDQIRADLDQGIETTNNTVAANVRLRFGETLVLSGLSEREHEVDRDEAPGLGRLPIGNLLLGNRQSRSVRKSVVVLLTLRRPNEDVPRAADDSLLARRYDRRLAAAVEATARRETPEAERLDAAAERLRRADLIARLPWRLPAR